MEKDKIEEMNSSGIILRTAVGEAAKEAIGIRDVYCKKKKSTLWWTAGVREAVTHKKKSFCSLLKARAVKGRNNYVPARNQVDKK